MTLLSRLLNITLQVSSCSSKGHLSLLCILLFLFYLNVGVFKNFFQDKAFLSTLFLVSACHLKVKDSLSLAFS